ncbi:Alg9-like mannosyltransferase [Wallemia mellicola]|nr:Alg9-like mannosyltransferase [Wallemia mellicola]TIB91892.1 Alg9-like mannosyltransferase [Wallemia mellicola]TIC43128.1 Alg9-like mannosyltransferase [Wallemia mellicola]TIC51972.1 Alg9-like mannosyltransferase [Wallemia mellicola]
MLNFNLNSYFDLLKHSGSLKLLYLNASSDQLMVIACIYNILWTYSLSEITGNVSQVDRVWTVLPLLYTAIPTFDLAIKTYLQAPQSTSLVDVLKITVNQRALLLLALQFIWSSRLTFNTARRGLMAFASEDYRWPILKKKLNWWQFKLLNLFFIAIAQNILHLLTGLPAFVLTKTPQYDINRNDYLLFTLGVMNIFGEFIADNQQYAYQSWKHAESTIVAYNNGTLTKEDKKKYTDGFNTSGLFAVSRHPNFAFEQTNWWIWALLVVLGSKQPAEEILSTFISPISMSLLFECSTRFTESITSSKYPNYKNYKKKVAIIALSYATRTFFQPDEYFQALEVGHWMYYGYGHLTWEWKDGLRSVMYPAIYAIGYLLGDFLSLPITASPRLINALLATLQDVALLAFLRRDYGNDKAKNYRQLLPAVPYIIGHLREQKMLCCRSKQLAKALVVIVITVAVRPTNALVWIPFALQLIYRRTVEFKTFVFLSASIGLASLWQTKANILNSISHFYGTNSVFYYFIQGWPLLLNTSAIYAIKGFIQARTPNEKCLQYTIIFVTLVYSLLAHKEWRFIQPLLPFAMVLAASKMHITRKIVILLSLGILPALYLMTTHMRGQVEVMEWLSASDNISSVGFYMPCHSTPWQSHLHRPDISLYSLQCPPIGYNEEDAFYASPQVFMKGKQMEDIVVVFEALFLDFPDSLEYLGKKYHPIHRISNSIIHEDSRRRGDIVILKRNV